MPRPLEDTTIVGILAGSRPDATIRKAIPGNSCLPAGPVSPIVLIPNITTGDQALCPSRKSEVPPYGKAEHGGIAACLPLPSIEGNIVHYPDATKR